MAGRLVGTVNGQPVNIDAKGDTLRFKLSRLRTAWRLRRTWPQASRPLQALGSQPPLRITIKTPHFGETELHPNPPWYVRPLLRR